MDENDFPEIRGITRLKYEHTSQGWWARYTRDGVTFGEVFRDNEYGSISASWDAAKKWHENTRELLPPLNRREFAQIKRKANKSGHVGVYKTFRRKKGGKEYCWVASWSPEKGKQKHEYFYISELGEKKAKELAIHARKEAIANLKEEWPEDYWGYRREQEGEISPYFEDVYAFEGDEFYKIHKAKERDQDIRKKKIEQFLELHGELFCEICKFSFEKEYGIVGKGLIEVHHLLPLAQMEPNHKTKIEELICICSNCHFAVHNGDPTENLEKLRFIFKAKNKLKKS